MRNDSVGYATSFLKDGRRGVVKALVEMFGDKNLALICGSMLRACFEYDFLVEELLQPDFALLDRFFDAYLVEEESFDLATDAFAIVTAALTLPQNQKLALAFLEGHYDAFFARFNRLLDVEKMPYITQRQALKLLGDILLEHAFYSIMMRFISDKENLRVIMTLMRVKSPAI